MRFRFIDVPPFLLMFLTFFMFSPPFYKPLFAMSTACGNQKRDRFQIENDPVEKNIYFGYCKNKILRYTVDKGAADERLLSLG